MAGSLSASMCATRHGMICTQHGMTGHAHAVAARRKPHKGMACHSCFTVPSSVRCAPNPCSDKKVEAEWTPQMEQEATHYYLTNYIGTLFGPHQATLVGWHTLTQWSAPGLRPNGCWLLRDERISAADPQGPRRALVAKIAIAETITSCCPRASPQTPSRLRMWM